MNVLSRMLGVFLVMFICACGNSGDNDGPTAAVREAVDDVRQQLAIRLGKPVPGISVYVQTPGGIWFVSSADSAADQLTQDTCFRFASNTKTFTAAAIMKIYQDGWIDIYDMISNPIPGYAIAYVPNTDAWNIPHKDEITIVQLLQHDAGVYDVDNESRADWDGKSYVRQQLDFDPLHQFTADELVGELTRLDLSFFPPGTDNHYSNTGYTVLSEIIARVYSARSGVEKTYSDYLYDHVIGGSSPVPLDTIRFPHLAADDTLPEPWVRGTEYTCADCTPIFYTAWNMSAHVAEGNGYGNFVDLNRFVRTLFSGRNVLDSQTVATMISTVSPHTASYALGCDHVRNLGYGHNGAIYGYLSTMRYNPDTGVSIVVMMPLIDGPNLHDCILEGIYKAAWATLSALGYPGQP